MRQRKINYMETIETIQEIEDKKARTMNMDFQYALTALKEGLAVRRSGWNGKDMGLKLQTPGANSKMSLPYIYIEYPVGHPVYPEGARCPWLASQTDLLSDDWEIVREA